MKKRKILIGEREHENIDLYNLNRSLLVSASDALITTGEKITLPMPLLPQDVKYSMPLGKSTARMLEGRLGRLQRLIF